MKYERVHPSYSPLDHQLIGSYTDTAAAVELENSARTLL